jgi:hypothetical protein
MSMAHMKPDDVRSSRVCLGMAGHREGLPARRRPASGAAWTHHGRLMDDGPGDLSQYEHSATIAGPRVSLREIGRRPDAVWGGWAIPQLPSNVPRYESTNNNKRNHDQKEQ